MNHHHSNLILIEGLTGSGKSILADFLARQLSYQGIPADWIHEGASPHPIFLQEELPLSDFMPRMLTRWRHFVRELAASDQTRVVEACLFNNLFERLMIEDLPALEILAYSRDIYMALNPIQPALIYLSQGDTRLAMQKNFANRGDSFRRFVIQLATGTKYAQNRNLVGLEGALRFWEDFVSLTDRLFERYPYPKTRLHLIEGDWDQRNLEALKFLEIPYSPEHSPSVCETASLTGKYVDRRHNRSFIVEYADDGLTINVFHNVRSRMIYESEKMYGVEGWHFKIVFEEDENGKINALSIMGKDVDYLRLVGTTAQKTS